MSAMDTPRTTRSRFPKQVEAALRTCVALYWSDARLDRTDVYARLTRLHRYHLRRCRRRERDGLPPRGGHLPCPSFKTFCRRVEDSECRATWASRYGEKSANARFDGVREGLTASRPMEMVVIDATRADVHLVVYDDETGELLGRPTLVLGIDVRTRALVGHLLTFAEPSLYTCMASLRRILLPKLDLVAEVPKERAYLLNLHGKPGTVVVDNAWEQVGKSFQDALEDVGIDVRWAPIHNPPAKAIVERVIQTVTKWAFHKAPGGIPYPPQLLRKFGLDPRETAVVTLAELEERVRDVVMYYNAEIHGGIGRAPIDAWREGVALRGVEVVDDPDFLDSALGEVADVSLTREGVKWDGIVYHHPDKVTLLLERLAPKDAGHSKRRTSVRARVKAKRNPGDLSRIHVWNDRDQEYVTLPAKHANFLRGLNRQQYAMLCQFAKATNVPFATDEERAELRLELVRKARAASPNLTGAARRRQRALLAPKSLTELGPLVSIGAVSARHDGLAREENAVPVVVRRRAGDGMPAKGLHRGRAKKPSRRTSAAGAEARDEAVQALEAARRDAAANGPPSGSGRRAAPAPAARPPALPGPKSTLNAPPDREAFLAGLSALGFGSVSGIDPKRSDPKTR